MRHVALLGQEDLLLWILEHFHPGWLSTVVPGTVFSQICYGYKPRTPRKASPAWRAFVSVPTLATECHLMTHLTSFDFVL